MLTYFEFEFENFGNIYFFPLFINCDDIKEAHTIKESFLSGIEERYNIRREIGPILAGEQIKSAYLDEYKEKMAAGKIVTLNVRSWQFKDYDPNFSLGFEKNLALIPFEKYIEPLDSTIAKVVSQSKIPVQILHKTRNADDFLLINVIDAKKHPGA